MTIDEYWKSLVHRVYTLNEVLDGTESVFYRLSCVYGETMIDGIESYLERRLDDFKEDMKVVRYCSFGDVAQEFEQAKMVIFGENELSQKVMDAVLTKLLESDPTVADMQSKIDHIYDRLIPKLDAMYEYTYQFGLDAGLFEDE